MPETEEINKPVHELYYKGTDITDYDVTYFWLLIGSSGNPLQFKRFGGVETKSVTVKPLPHDFKDKDTIELPDG